MKKIKFFAFKDTFTFILSDGRNFKIPRFDGTHRGEPKETEKSKKIAEILANSKQDPSLLDEKTSPLLEIIDPKEALKDSPFRIDPIHCKVYVDGNEVHEYIAKKIIELHEANKEFNYIVNFWKRLVKNPSESAKTDLFKFLEHNGHPITRGGYFLAYKRVRSDYYSIHNYSEGSSDNISNAIGNWVKMDRSLVDSSRTQTCSSGLHAANWNYAKHNYCSGSGKLIELLIDPEDVCAIPEDYNNTKMRVCAYYVLKDAEVERNEKFIDLDFNLPPKTEGIDVVTSEITNEDLEDANTNTYYKEYKNSIGCIWAFQFIKDATLCYADITNGPVAEQSKRVYIKVSYPIYKSWVATSNEVVYPVKKEEEVKPETKKNSVLSFVKKMVGKK